MIVARDIPGSVARRAPRARASSGAEVPTRFVRPVRYIRRVDVLLWVLFGVLPAVAAVLVGVGVAGPRWLALALAVAICVPFGMADGWPPWPWQLDLLRGQPRPALWWIVLLGGLLGAAHDLRALPRAIALGGEVLLVLMQIGRAHV